MAGLWAVLAAVQHELLLLCAVGLAISALDDLAVDIGWAAHRLWTWLTPNRRPPILTGESLPPVPDNVRFAVFVPAWKEWRVIGQMIETACRNWGPDGYRLYVGVYPNDPKTQAVVAAAAERHPQVRMVVTERPGGTSKADCLNNIWRHMCWEEARGEARAAMIVLHDAEDVVDPLELRLHATLRHRADFVQIPVMPLALKHSPWISGHYCDEFAEAHTKQMVLRQAVGAALPSAGVGCAIDRGLLGELAGQCAGRPFDENSVTEDYELGIHIAALGGRGVIPRVRRADGSLIATRAYFPGTFVEAVGQKARWLEGIALSGWDRIGWQGGLCERWMRLRDRKPIMGALLVAMAYVALVIALIRMSAGYPFMTPMDPFIPALIAFSTVMLVLRFLVRTVLVAREYGWDAVHVAPRLVIANVILLFSAERALRAYVRRCFGGQVTWRKTAHEFPEEPAT